MFRCGRAYREILQVAKIVGDEGSVVAIEPDPTNYAALKKGIEINKTQNVIAVNVAAWHCDTKLKLIRIFVRP